jgi:hypothetical protein
MSSCRRSLKRRPRPPRRRQPRCARINAPPSVIARPPAASAGWNRCQTWIISGQISRPTRTSAAPAAPARRSAFVEQGLGGPDLDEERREAPEIGIDRHRQRRTRVGAAEIELGHFDEPRLVDDRVVRGLARHRRSNPFQVDPRRDTPSAGGLRQPGVAQRHHRGDDEPVAGERHPLRRDPLRQQKPVARERILDRGRKRMLWGQAVIERQGGDPGRAPGLSDEMAVAERMVETRAELPFIGDQIVCLSHDQAARSGPAAAQRDTQLRRLEKRLRYPGDLDVGPPPRHLKSHLASVAFPACPRRAARRQFRARARDVGTASPMTKPRLARSPRFPAIGTAMAPVISDRKIAARFPGRLSRTRVRRR